MDHFIEGRKVTQEDINSPVTYIPRHANGDASHPDAEQGTISSFTEHALFVRFHSATGANTPPSLLVWG
jgi:hypothetical protein